MAVSKPLAGQQIDFTQPLARGVIAGWMPPSALNLSPNGSNAVIGSAVSQVGSAGGTAALTTASYPTGNVQFNNSADFAKIGTGDFTIAFVHAPTVAANPASDATVGLGQTAGLWLGDRFGASSFGYYGILSAVARSGSIANRVNVMMGVRKSGMAQCFINGVGGSAGALTNSFPTSAFSVGSFGGSGYSNPSRYLLAVVWNRALSEAEAREFAINPWALWPDEPQLVFAPVTGTTITAAWTEADDTVAVTESSSNAANLAWTEGNDTAAISETSSASASISWAEADDIAAAAITAASQSSLAWLEESDTIAINVLSGDATAVSDWIITARRRGRR